MTRREKFRACVAVFGLAFLCGAVISGMTLAGYGWVPPVAVAVLANAAGPSLERWVLCDGPACDE
jgi:hypothetical protein